MYHSVRSLIVAVHVPEHVVLTTIEELGCLEDNNLKDLAKHEGFSA